MASDSKETERLEKNAIEEVFEFYHDSGDELNTEWVTHYFNVHPTDHGLLNHSEEEDGNFYDGYLDLTNVSRSLTPSPNAQDDKFDKDPEEYADAMASMPTPTQLEDRLRSIQSKMRSRSGTVTLQNMYGGESDNLPASDDEGYQSSESSDWEP